MQMQKSVTTVCFMFTLQFCYIEKITYRSTTGDQCSCYKLDWSPVSGYTARLEFESCLRTLGLGFLFGLGQSFERLESVGCIPQLPLK